MIQQRAELKVSKHDHDLLPTDGKHDHDLLPTDGACSGEEINYNLHIFFSKQQDMHHQHRGDPKRGSDGSGVFTSGSESSEDADVTGFESIW